MQNRKQRGFELNKMGDATERPDRQKIQKGLLKEVALAQDWTGMPRVGLQDEQEEEFWLRGKPKAGRCGQQAELKPAARKLSSSL